MSRQTRARSPATEVTAISSEDLAQCRRDRDFTNILDLRNCWHTSFLKRLREHGHTSRFLWKQLQESEDARSECIDSFLDLYGMEYWGVTGRSVQDTSCLTPLLAVMWSSILRIVLNTEAEVTIDHAEEETWAEATASQLPVSMSQDMSMTEPAFMPVALANIPTTTATRRVKRRNTIEHRMTPPSDEARRLLFLLVDANLTRALYAKYRHDTFFLITTDGPRATAAAWHKYKDFGAASLFLLDMGRARGLENRWWTAEAQMMIDGEGGPSEADYVLAAKEVIAEASVTLEWSGEEVLVRWDNSADWELVRQMVQKAWISRELGFQMINVFKVKVLLHLENNY
ncbi:hypothetical protein BJX66DRAFT_334260 [Aspergillus keveii]|uniref:Uncharacterized protein n=1 Tax=Aspergillus keveii TaxID=714993 RepID=A0ABR4GH09_9EURO